ncbi:MAG: threonine--tRNA ligase [Actinobacteria bacterium]|nr:threonine--tRNA ligase [Actinomycetota bacterium]
MIKIKFEDLGEIEVKKGTSIKDAADFIDHKSAERAVAAGISGSKKGEGTNIVVDMGFVLLNSTDIILINPGADERSLDILNHSTAHLMAAAIKKIYPDAIFAIGPSIKNGFYYDFEIKGNISPDDLPAIEKQMKKLIGGNHAFLREEVTKKEAREIFKDNVFKLELISEIPDKTVSIYRTGDFTDLCKGPHIPSTSRIKAFKLLSIAGAYWRGDEKNKMLVRIYGTSFYSPEDLDHYLERIEKAKQSDHRKIGKDLDLFSFHDEAPGFPFFHPRGMIIRNRIIDYWREEHLKEGYLEVNTPIILCNDLWKTSGHWDNYAENMYFVEIDEKDYAVKPMNCPGNILIYKSSQHSYRELPLKYAELGLVHRHEKSGVLHGLFRVRNFTQDDAHIFCNEEQLPEQIGNIIDLIDRMYGVFGFEKYHVELSTRPEKSIGSVEMWDKAEGILKDIIDSKKIDYSINEGDGAFYGPKIDFHIMDCLDRTWQCATIQLDFAMPEKFDIQYVGEDNEKHRPVMIHRTVLGSLERFIGILIENYSGNLPPWLAPEQVIILPISEKYEKYSIKVYNGLQKAGCRVTIDNRVESLNKKIRQAEMNKIPYMVIVGDKEERSGTITVRKKIGEEIREIKIPDFIKIFKDIVDNRKTEY